jgi:putative membrane protein
MIGLFLRWLIPFAAVLLAAYLLPDRIVVQDYGATAIFAVVLAVLNAAVRPILQLLALPLTCLTLGLFHFVINAAIFGLAAWLTPGVGVNGFLAALVGAIVLSVLGLAASWFIRSAR